MGRRVWIVLGLVLSCSSLCKAADKPEFSDVVIDKPFRPYLLSNPLLMGVTGAKVIREKGGNKVILSVASTVLKNNSSQEQLRAEKVCRIKALAGIVAEKEGIQVCHMETVREKTTVVIDEIGEKANSVSEYLQITKTRVEGITKDMPVVGRWRSKNGDVFYLAIGVLLDQKGEPIEVND